MWNRRHRKLKKELRRIGWSQFDGVMLREGEAVTFEHAIHEGPSGLPWQDAATPLRWEGTVAEALDRLATLPDEPAGINAFWPTFCPDAEPYFRDWDKRVEEKERMEGELRRLDVLAPRAMVDAYHRPWERLRHTLRDGRVPSQPWIHGLYAQERGPRVRDFNLRWRGTAAEFLARTSQLPDGCGSEAFWRAFPKPDETEGETTFRAQGGHEPEGRNS